MSDELKADFAARRLDTEHEEALAMDAAGLWRPFTLEDWIRRIDDGIAEVPPQYLPTLMPARHTLLETRAYVQGARGMLLADEEFADYPREDETEAVSPGPKSLGALAAQPISPEAQARAEERRLADESHAAILKGAGRPPSAGRV